ncbi:MAG: hypothetical protein AAF939_08925 [Planctomycetota bacterium]
MLTFYRAILIASFAMWFGGFTFYTSIVVPIGTDVLGSAYDQGLITRKVTVWLNLFGIPAVILMAMETLLCWRSKIDAWKKWTAISTLGIAMATLGYLFPLHQQLDEMMNLEAGFVDDDDRFYFLHRVYLWVSTVQWAACWIWLFVVCNFWSSQSLKSNLSKTFESQTD